MIMLDIKPMLAVQSALRDLKRQDIRIHYVKSTDSICFVKGDKRASVPADMIMQAINYGQESVKEFIEGFIQSSQL